MASRPFSQSTSNQRSLATLGLPSGLVASLSKAGYETINDLAGTSEAELLEELNLTDGLPQNLLSYLPGSSTSQLQIVPPTPTQPVPASHILIHSASDLHGGADRVFKKPLAKPRTYTTTSVALNTLLSSGAPALRLNGIKATAPSPEGGLRLMFVLEISGPPGSGKGCLALELIRSAVERGEEVLVADTQSSMIPGRIYKALDGMSSAEDGHAEHPANLVLRIYLSSLPHVIAFMKTLPTYLEANPKIKLLVLSSLSFVFQPSDSLSLSTLDKNRLSSMIKQTLTRVCMENGVTVIITSQTSTRMIGPDGKSGNFDTGTRAILTSQLGPNFFTASRSYRVILSRDSQGVRHARLLSSPALASLRDQVSKGKAKQDRATNSLSKEQLKVAFMIDENGRIGDV